MIEDREKMIEEAIQYARATLAVEGLQASPEAEEIARKRLKGEISEEEALELLRNL